MYSVVLLTAMAASTSLPAYGHMRSGGYGSYAPYSTYTGYGCGGCYGGHVYNYNYGYSCHGCYGGCYGGAYVPHYGGYGPGFGYHGGCYGAYGAWHGDPNFFGGCFGCHGGHSGYGIPIPVPDVRSERPVDPFPAINPIDKKPAAGKEAEEVPLPKEKKFGAPDDKKKPVDDKKIPEEKKDPEEKKGAEKQVRVKVRIDVPDGGRLFVDGQRINAVAGSRLFQTPLLAPDQKYYYDIRIEIDRNGQVIGEQRRVIVEPGRNVAVEFPNLMPGTTTVQVRD